MARYAVAIVLAFLLSAYALASFIDEKFSNPCTGVVALVDGGKAECFELQYPEK